MNCKPGDLAIIVKSMAGNEGKFVTCLKLVPAHVVLMPDMSIQTKPAWKVDRALNSYRGVKCDLVIDEWLRPIRPGDLEEHDEEHKELAV